jgi:hypothetical protein
MNRGFIKNPDNERRDEAGLQDSDGSLGIKKIILISSLTGYRV